MRAGFARQEECMGKPFSKYHYEFVAAREEGHQWRVGDGDDDMVTDFATEAQAKTFVDEHNKKLPADY